MNVNWEIMSRRRHVTALKIKVTSSIYNEIGEIPIFFVQIPYFSPKEMDDGCIPSKHGFSRGITAYRIEMIE